MSSTFKDTILLYRAKVKQEPEAYAELYDYYVQRIYRFVYFKVSNREEAEDITSEVFLKAWNYLRDNKEVKSFSGLLYRIARNSIIDLYRAKSNRPETAFQEIKEEGDEGKQMVEYGDEGKWQAATNTKLETEKILQSLKKLKQEYQEVITLRFVDELDIEEIAEITGRGKISVRVTLHRALKKLKEMLGD